MSSRTAGRAVEYFLPRSTRTFHVLFFGGEPLLAFPLLAEIVPAIVGAASATGRRPRFGLTTNGSLLDGQVRDLLERYRFRVGLSYDGGFQDLQRAPGSKKRLEALLEELAGSRRIRLETNSVFTPESVGSLSETILGLIDKGIPSVRYALSYRTFWTGDRIAAFALELGKLERGLVRRARRGGARSLRNFVEGGRRGLRACSAGEDRIGVDPRGGVWGCCVFSDWARALGTRTIIRRYKIGRIKDSFDRLDSGRAAVAARHARMSIAGYESPAGPCALCPDRGHCWICPAASAGAGGGLRTIPGFACELLRLQSRAAARMAAELR
jgi:sulfatase maturation enzyme AslB (radical SAM superfamily)